MRDSIVEYIEMGVVQDDMKPIKQELIRCKDCRWYKTNYSWNGKEHRVCVVEPYEPVRQADDYCSRAERKDDETD